MNVLIIGSKGFIGSNLQVLTGWDGVDIESVDIRDIDSVRAVARGYSDIVLLSALTGVEPSVKQEKEYIRTNVNGVFNVASVCHEFKIRLTFASSSSVYEAKSPYAKTKQSGEDIINAFVRHGLESCILRFFTVFGEGNRKDMAIYKFIKSVMNGTQITLYGDCTRDWTYVKDLCETIKAVVENRVTGTYDAGFGNETSVKDIVRYLEGIMNIKADIKEVGMRGFDARNTKSETSLVKLLGINQTPIKSALKRTVRNIVINNL